VVGAGGGMVCALFVALQGLRTLLIEGSPFVGGTTALSASALWIPNTSFGDASGDTPRDARTYLEAATEGRSPNALREAFLNAGPKAVATLIVIEHTDVQLRAFAYHPDYLSALPGSTTSGRVLDALPFDGRELGAQFELLRPPIPEFTVPGGMMVDRIDIGHLLKLGRSFESISHSARLIARYAVDRLNHARGTRLVRGNALVGRLLRSLQKRDVTLWTSAKVERLLGDERHSRLSDRGSPRAHALRAGHDPPRRSWTATFHRRRLSRRGADARCTRGTTGD
jgi:hypothetical protein